MSKPIRVLLVEDSADDADLILNQLERGGYAPIYQRVDNAAAMNQALEQQWDVVLADHNLPKFSSTAALALLQSKGQDLPFIIVSGSIKDEIAVAAMKSGAHDYLMKGNLARLVPAIERELAEAASRQERQRIQSELKESEDRWQLALRGTNDGIWDWNVKTNQVFFSPRWKEMLGYADDEIGDRFDEWTKLVHPDDSDLVNQAIQDHFAKKTEFFRAEFRMLCQDGSYKWILSRGQALWDQAEPKRMVGSHTDITPTKQMEATLRQQAENLTQVNRLKDEFLAVVSHELRTPLNSILGWSQILGRCKLDQSAMIRAIETIERNAKLQKHLVEDLLDVSSMIQGKFSIKVSPTDLVPIMKEAIETVRVAAEAKAIELKTVVNSVGLVNGDANRLQQVMWNLLSNAIKFTPSGGRVEIRLSRVEKKVGGAGGAGGAFPSSASSALFTRPSPLTFSPSPITDYAQIQVIDTGIGIKQSFLAYVFDRFRQENSSTTRAYSGLGIGLAIARHLVELHGGTVHVDSPGVGLGTTFTIQLPLLQPASFPLIAKSDRDTSSDNGDHIQTPPSPQFLASTLTNVRILVVDDDTDNREFLDIALTTDGADVIAAACVDEALKAFKSFKPNVIVSDIGMPEQDGYALIRQIRMLEPCLGGNTPAIALSGYTRDSDRNKALDAGFDLHLSKPVDPMKLVEAIADLCKKTTLV